MPSAVARVLGTLLSSERSHTETMAAVLAPLRLLLVLDNCEHVTDEVAAFVEAACAAAPGVRVLATSQETLKVADEHVYRLGVLPLPQGDAPGEAMRAGAVELFAARAQAVAPHFVLGPDNVDAIVEICRRLDGIPLAIELAAARVPLLGVEGLRSRLDERFNVLTAGARAVLRRHQTLRATLEWSHGLLTADEQRVFRRLGVFAGSFTLEAAQHVARDAQIDGWAALDHLGALVDKSLVLAEGDPVPRYRLLETTRAYALERLGEAGETEATLRLHAEALLATAACVGRRPRCADAGGRYMRTRDPSSTTCAPRSPGRRAQTTALNLRSGWRRTRCASGTPRINCTRASSGALAIARLLRDDLPASLVARYWLNHRWPRHVCAAA